MLAWRAMFPFFARLWKALPTPLRQLAILLSQPTYTLGVSAVVLDAEGRVLLFRHRMREGRGWELPGGFVDRGESLEGALQRELREEAGLSVEIVRQLESRVASSHHVDVVYLVQIADGDLDLNQDEIEAGRFFPESELPADTDGASRHAIQLAAQAGA